MTAKKYDVQQLIEKFNDKIESIGVIISRVRDLKASAESIGVNCDSIFSVNVLYPNMLMDDISRMEDDFAVTLAPLLSRYYQVFENKGYEKEEERTSKKIYKELISMGYFMRIDEICKRIQKALDAIEQSCAKYPRKSKKTVCLIMEIKDIVHSNLQINIKRVVKQSDDPLCSCGNSMELNTTTSELVCGSCGSVITIHGAAFDDGQIFDQDGAKSKSGGFDPKRHYTTWSNNIQGREKKEIPEHVIEKFKKYMADNEILKSHLNVEVMRTILSAIGETKFNDNVSKLYWRVTHIPPVQLSYEENRIFEEKFMRIVELRNEYRISKNIVGKNNRPYYPYYFYKIAEEEFKNNREKLKILNFIHLQSHDTLVERDREFKEIVKMQSPRDNLVYTDTERRFIR